MAAKKATSVAQVSPVLPVRRAAPLSLGAMAVGEWFSQLVAQVPRSSEILAVTMLLDHAGFVQALLARLRAGGCAVRIMVDKEAFEQGISHSQRARLRALRAARARVFLGKGTMRGGRLHAKAVVFDRRIAFMGSANLTNKALRNAELCWHVEGPQVSAILRFMEEHLEASLEW